jgi:hypothetical protein
MLNIKLEAGACRLHQNGAAPSAPAPQHGLILLLFNYLLYTVSN